MEQRSIYAQIADRTTAMVYIGVVGPVGDGKIHLLSSASWSSSCCRNIENIYERERATDGCRSPGSG